MNLLRLLSKSLHWTQYPVSLHSESISRFYDTGYADGFAHGHIHGLIEGRSLGRTKGFEMWEELGFYEGYARMWSEIYAKQSRSDE